MVDYNVIDEENGVCFKGKKTDEVRNQKSSEIYLSPLS